eukprot:14601372-Ditylum_brightwellii.AAC.2
MDSYGEMYGIVSGVMRGDREGPGHMFGEQGFVQEMARGMGDLGDGFMVRAGGGCLGGVGILGGTGMEGTGGTWKDHHNSTHLDICLQTQESPAKKDPDKNRRIQLPAKYIQLTQSHVGAGGGCKGRILFGDGLGAGRGAEDGDGAEAHTGEEAKAEARDRFRQGQQGRLDWLLIYN